MRRIILACMFAASILAAGLPIVPIAAADETAAKRQYRVARRLAAEGSPDAAAALRKVVELDPAGELADDALLEEALLQRLPQWPSELGGLNAGSAETAGALLKRILDEMPAGDRAVEARYRYALLLLEPLEGQDLSAARLELLSVATMSESGDWPVLARYAIGWMDWRSGELDRASAAFRRLVVDRPASEAAGRGRIALATIMMRASEFGDAAGLLQQAVELDGENTMAREYRELAVRSALRQAGAGGRWSSGERSALDTGLRGITAVTRMPEGNVLLADRRAGVLKVLDLRGSAVSQWPLKEVAASCVDSLGRIWAVAGTTLHRIGAEGPRSMATFDRFTPGSGMAADGTGVVWVVEKRGDRIAAISPGKKTPTIFWEDGDARIGALAWDGLRLLAMDERGRRVLAIGSDGSSRVVTSAGIQKPVGISADLTGQFAVLDGRSQEVLLYGPDGEILDRVSVTGAGVSKPVAIALGEDGSLDIADGSGGKLVRIP